MDDYDLTPEERRRLQMEGLMAFGFGLLGAPKGRELERAGQAGLLGMSMVNQGQRDLRRDKLAAEADRRSRLTYDMQAAAFKAQQEQAAAMEAARAGAVTPPQPGMPEYGPPTAQGAMQPPVAAQPGGFDYGRYAQNLAVGGFPEKALALRQSMVGDSPIDKPKPSDFTPESLAEYVRTRDPAKLVRVTEAAPSPVGKVNPSDFTPQSVAAFLKAGGTDMSILVPIPKPGTTVNVDARQPPPKGYRWSQDGRSLEPIPGGPEDTGPKDRARAEGAVTRADVVIGKVDDALKNVGIITAGPVGAVMSRIPGSPALDLKKTVDTVKANIGFQELQMMREASPTGGALGQVAVQELNMLQATIASLDTEQSPGKLRERLSDVKKHFNNWRSIMKQAARQAPAGGGWSIVEER